MKDREPGRRFVGMHLLHRLPQRSAIVRTSRSLAVIFLLLAALFTSPLASSATASASASCSVPPAYPDTDHVYNGCHLSTLAYLARFREQYPHEQGEPLVISMQNADGVRRSHTVALISWHGQSWCRDEYFGVFALDSAVQAQPDRIQLIARVEDRLDAHAQKVVRRTGKCPRPAPRDDMSVDERTRDVNLAAGIIPYATTVYLVRCGKQVVPMAFFRPTDRTIAIYDPMHGTCLIESAAQNEAKVVSLVASRLGYHVADVRPSLGSLRGTLVTAANLPTATLPH